MARGRPGLQTWIDQYQLADRAYRVPVTSESPLVGKSLKELLRAAGVNIAAIVRSLGLGTEMIRPAAQTALQVNAPLLVDVCAPEIAIETRRRRFLLDALPLIDDIGYVTDARQEIGMVEAIVHSGSTLFGRTVPAARIRSEHGQMIVDLRRGRPAHRRGLLHEKLKAGDTLPLVGFWRDIRRLLADDGNLVVLNMAAQLDDVLAAVSRASQAPAVLVLGRSVGRA